ncbi:MAG: hypothetical protein J6X66_02525 [Lachnospiraceae bacterium]|nr:hypothetical protein [Lachnospiraceae bacterium]
MSKRQNTISRAINSKGVYKSQETGQLWIVEKERRNAANGQNYVIKHKHPDRNLHVHAYALSKESAVKKILKHEEWTLGK